MPIQAAIYVRASPGLPVTPDDQEASLRELAAERGLMVATVIRDIGTVTGKSGQRRQGLIRLLDTIKAGAHGVVLVHSIHLLGRDLADLVSLLIALSTAGVRLIAPAEQIDTADPGRIGLLDVVRLLDAHSRFGQRERILEGQLRARAAGVRIGRPPIPQSRITRVRNALEAGVGIREAARRTGVSPTSVLRVRQGTQKAEMLEQSSAD